MPYPVLRMHVLYGLCLNNQKVLLDDPFHLNSQVIRQELHGPRLQRHALERPRNGYLVHPQPVRDLSIAQTLFQTLSFKNLDPVHGHNLHS